MSVPTVLSFVLGLFSVQMRQTMAVPSVPRFCCDQTSSKRLEPSLQLFDTTGNIENSGNGAIESRLLRVPTNNQRLGTWEQAIGCIPYCGNLSGEV